MKGFTGGIVFTLLVSLSGNISVQAISFQGQFSGWFTYNDTASDRSKIGLRYLPELRISKSLIEGKTVDAEIGLNSYASAPVNLLSSVRDNSGVKLYRLWLRYSSAQFETRLGLQKISFGPAKILRSLMWFDRLDVRDPLKLTDGVYALLGRYYFLNNANIWVWGLSGNDSLKGLETFKTDKDRIEFGGRCQFPVPKGECAFSYNRRYIDQKDWKRIKAVPLSDGLENRLAVDGNWDLGIGLWFEASAGEIKIDSSQRMWREFLTVGSDYTFQSGIHLLLEHFIHSTGSKINRMDKINRFSALSMDYIIGIIDRINAIGYYDWKKNKVYAYLGWQRTYDNWLVNLGLFSSSEEEVGMYGGKGFLCMLIYNH